MSEILRTEKPIAWVCETVLKGGAVDLELKSNGMTRDEIIANFPVSRSDINLPYNRQKLIEAIILEAQQEVRMLGIERPRKNIRFFWYERLMYIILNVMGEPGDDDNLSSISGSINRAWKSLVESGQVTYERLNLYSEKERGYNVGVVEDSPYPSVLVFVEKESYFAELADLAETYEISFVASGGQASRAAAMAYTARLEDMKIDLSQTFTVFSFCDFDPEGWTIPEGFCEHLRLKISDVRLVRLGVLRKQITDSIIKFGASPYPLEAKMQASKKGKLTKYENFAAESGGLYIQNYRGESVPARVELDVYQSHLREMIITELSRHLEGFPYQIRGLKQQIESDYNTALNKIENELANEVGQEYEPYFEAIRKAERRLEIVKSERCENENSEIELLVKQIETLEEIKKSKTSDIEEKQNKLSRLKNELSQKISEREITIEPGHEPEDLIYHIEGNGGWKSWAAGCGLRIATSDALADCARSHTTYNYTPEYNETRQTVKWIYSRVKDAVSVDVETPEETPDEMIASVVGSEWLE